MCGIKNQIKKSISIKEKEDEAEPSFLKIINQEFDDSAKYFEEQAKKCNLSGYPGYFDLINIHMETEDKK